MLKALLVDLDGTLVDSLPGLYRVYLKFMDAQNLQGNSDEFIELMGPSLAQIVKLLKKRYRLKSSEADLLQTYSDLLENCYAHQLKLMPGAREALLKAKEKGLKIALATSAPRKWVDVMLKTNILEIPFDVTVTADDVHAGKPNPAVFKKALELLKVKADEALVIDDAPAGIEAARRAGIYALNYLPRAVSPSIHEGYAVITKWSSLPVVLKW